MKKEEEMLNSFLVSVFNDILRLEEESIAQSGVSDLSVSELHVLEQIEKLSGDEQKVGMGKLASALNVTGGTLSIAIKTLEQKGYVKRQKDSKDKRRVYLMLSDGAYAPLCAHNAFHTQLVAHACEKLDDGQLQSLSQALASLHALFTKGT
ncbi:MAG: MarR family transcriptional regulator [Oscillospiraceae bacterium]